MKGHDRADEDQAVFTWLGESLQVPAELMRDLSRERDPSCAALICQHATQERDEAIAAGMGKLLRQGRRKAKRTGERARILGAAGCVGRGSARLPSATKRSPAWHNLATLARWCRTESYLDSATATASRTKRYP